MEWGEEEEGKKGRRRRRRKRGEEEREREMGGRTRLRYFLNVPTPDSPTPSGPALLKLNLGTCTLETRSHGPGNPPFFWFLSSLPPHQTLLPIFSQQHLQLLCCAAQGCTCSVLLALPRSFGPLYSRSLSLLTLAIPHTAHCFQRLPLGA